MKKKLSFSSLSEDKDYLTYRRNQVYIVVNEAPVKQVLVPNCKKVASGITAILSASETLFLVKPSSLFLALFYSLASNTAARFGQIVIRASRNYRTVLLV